MSAHPAHETIIGQSQVLQSTLSHCAGNYFSNHFGAFCVGVWTNVRLLVKDGNANNSGGMWPACRCPIPTHRLERSRRHRRLPPLGSTKPAQSGTYPCPSRLGHTWIGNRPQKCGRFSFKGGVPLREVRAAGVGHRRIGQDVDQRWAPRRKRPLERAGELARRPHQLAVTPQHLDDLVIARLRP